MEEFLLGLAHAQRWFKRHIGITLKQVVLTLLVVGAVGVVAYVGLTFYVLTVLDAFYFPKK